MPNQIVLKGEPPRRELVSSEIITPGYLCERDGSGGVQLHSGADGAALPLVAVEEDFVGDGISDTYASGDRVQLVIGGPGDQLYMMLAASQTVSEGDPLMSAGDGTLQKSTLDATIVAGAIVGYAAEDVTTTGAVGRIRVDIA